MTVILTPGPRHEAMVFEQLLETGAVKRRRPGRPKRRPHRIIGDKGYSRRPIREYVCHHETRMTIPRKRDEDPTGPLNRALYSLRNCIERLIARCKQFHRLATCDEKGAANLWLGVL
jgi:transposase